jgi:arabinofuranosyltransferase
MQRDPLVIVLIALLLFIILRNSWICDDGYITFRTIDNFVNGYGLVYNVGERVQTYTHPLWMFVLSASYYFTREIFFTTSVISIQMTLLALLVLTSRIAVSRDSLLFSLLVLTLSKSFVDYSTSGLENSLAHFILAVFLAVYFCFESSPRKLFLLSLLCSLGILNRMDAGLLYMPVLLYEFCRLRKARLVGIVLLGQLPFFLWEVFSIFYYGFPVPNTAYAKLNTGIPQTELLVQGGLYVLNSLKFDPITLVSVSASIVLVVVTKKRQCFPVAAGLILYLLYVVRIGGDFMSGRFFTVPLFCAVAMLARHDVGSLRVHLRLLLFVLAMVIGFSAPRPTLFPWKTIAHEINDRETGIALEREYDTFDNYRHLKRTRSEGIQAAEDGRKVYLVTGAGIRGLYAGRDVHVVDYYALLDPLLARLPAARNKNWRIGHFLRVIPEGYLETLELQSNRLVDPSLGLLYEKLSIITQGELWDAERVCEIWRMNWGKYRNLIDFDAYRHPHMTRVDILEISESKTNGVAWNHSDNVLFTANGVEVCLGESLSHARKIEISLRGDSGYEIVYYDGDEEIAAQEILAPGTLSESLSVYRLSVPSRAAKLGFSRIRVFPIGDRVDPRFPIVRGANYSLGHIRLW